MRKVISADLRRIIVKVVPWVLIAGAYIFLYVTLRMDLAKALDINFYFLNKMSDSFPTVSLIVGFASLLGIYGDEFKSMVMIGVIGRGISREKFVLSKFFDLVLLSAVMYALSILYVIFLGFVFGVRLVGPELTYLVCHFLFQYLDAVVYVCVAAVFYFLSESAAIGLFAYLAFNLIVPVTLAFINLMTRLSKYHLDRYYVSGLLSRASSSFIMGDMGEGFLYLFLILTVYMAGSIAVTMLIFRKKELNF